MNYEEAMPAGRLPKWGMQQALSEHIKYRNAYDNKCKKILHHCIEHRKLAQIRKKALKKNSLDHLDITISS